MNDNKRIALNTMAIYFRLIVTTLIGLITSRYLLLALGQSDFGLYSVVGSIIVLMNTIGVAMHTTTRRYINVEMGKGELGNPNRIFNITLVIHICFALAFLGLAETVGIWYINHFLNVESGKIKDAHFIFQVSVIVACIGLMNIPYQGLMDAFQKFWQIAAIDTASAVLKLIFVFLLFFYDGNLLRFYAVSMGLLTFFSFIAFHLLCRWQWREIVTYRFYRERVIYSEILVFNNYTALGAFSWLGKRQGTIMLVNYFFGTLVNGALAIAYQVFNFTEMFASNMATAAAPQITQAYSANLNNRAFALCSRVTRMTILIMVCIFFSLNVGLEKILVLWLKIVPEGAVQLTQWILVVGLVNSFTGCLNTYIQAIGFLKWFQILGSTLDIVLILFSFLLFKIGFPPVSILMSMSVFGLFSVSLSLFLLNKICSFPVRLFIRKTYCRPLVVIVIMGLVISVSSFYSHSGILLTPIGIVGVGVLSLLLSFYVGLTNEEREKIGYVVKEGICKMVNS